MRVDSSIPYVVLDTFRQEVGTLELTFGGCIEHDLEKNNLFLFEILV